MYINMFERKLYLKIYGAFSTRTSQRTHARKRQIVIIIIKTTIIITTYTSFVAIRIRISISFRGFGQKCKNEKFIDGKYSTPASVKLPTAERAYTAFALYL